MLQSEETKAEMEKKVSTLVKYIQNKNKISKDTKKELVGMVNDLHEHCHLLYPAFNDLGAASGGRKGKPVTASSSRSSSDLDYYSSEEVEISSAGGETLSSSVYLLTKLHEAELTHGYLKRQVSNLKQETEFLRDQNMELAGDIRGKRNEDREHFKGMMITKGEAALLRDQKKELESQLEKKTNEVSETRMRLKRVESETEERAKAEMKIAEENEALRNKVYDQQKLIKEQEGIIHRLSVEIKDHQKLLKEQRDSMDKFSEEQKLMKRWSFGSKLNTNLLGKKMEELAEDFRMKMEDHLRILYRRIHVAEQIHIESKNNYINTQSRGNRGDLTVSETQFKKIKEMVEQGLAGPEMAIKKLEQGEELTTRVTRLAKEIDSARKWVQEKKSNMKHEVETLEAKLECREAQETLLKEKLSKLEAKLAEEGTGKLSLAKAMRRIKNLEINVKERDFELLSLGEEKREAIRQLCVLVDYQRCRYDDLKASIFKVALQA
ncbi:hypothetical protein EUTSA_v10028203mg [Eutrema salsugineum]|uniref:NAB domain-containing protein n=1 Tax=Eutrema salsugineum TaxID=72664 RepID=V4LW74_EUTSA|nr:COP1-interactive protein 1 [Eutrema salsugineum]ESQ46762.1 hypothetical protein EUTSA_v10028203mg [Eutrema salsugineum]